MARLQNPQVDRAYTVMEGDDRVPSTLVYSSVSIMVVPVSFGVSAAGLAGTAPPGCGRSDKPWQKERSRWPGHGTPSFYGTAWPSVWQIRIRRTGEAVPLHDSGGYAQRLT